MMESNYVECDERLITCHEDDNCFQTKTLTVPSIDDGSWTNIPLNEDSDNKSDQETLIFDEEGNTFINEYATQFILIDNEENANTIDKVEQHQTPYILLESGLVDQVVLFQQDDECIETVARIQTKKPKNHICQVPGCDRAYSSLHHLKVHERVHTGYRPYKCSIEGCSKDFNTEYGRKAHIRTHTGEKPFVCAYEACGKGFKTSGDLHKHVRTHTGERPFLCPMLGCDKSFSTSSICRIHIRSHTGERPYVCQEEGCDKIFASLTNFKNHQRIHTGEKPFLCQVDGCGRRFTEYSSLYKHRLVHSQMKRYRCNFCEKSYRQMSSLTTHKRIEHSVVVHSHGGDLLLEQAIDNDLEND